MLVTWDPSQQNDQNLTQGRVGQDVLCSLQTCAECPKENKSKILNHGVQHGKENMSSGHKVTFSMDKSPLVLR